MAKWIARLTTFNIPRAHPWMLATEQSSHSLRQSNDCHYYDNFIPSSQINESEISEQYEGCNAFLLVPLQFMMSLFWRAIWHDDTGTFPCKQPSFLQKCGSLKCSVQLKYSCLFKHEIGGTALQRISQHDIPKAAKNFQVFCVCLSGTSTQKDTRQWIIKQAACDLCFFQVAVVLQKNVRSIMAKEVKNNCGRKVKETGETQNKGYWEQTKHSLHSVAPLCIPTSMRLTLHASV